MYSFNSSSTSSSRSTFMIRLLARIEEKAKEYGVEKIVLGFPKHMNNDIGERAEKSNPIILIVITLTSRIHF